MVILKASFLKSFEGPGGHEADPSQKKYSYAGQIYAELRDGAMMRVDPEDRHF